ncbi:MAG: YitT family protein, partial [Clostridiales bacterium]|nr:YitT family protein [Clostridiales bacterium]
MKKTNKFFYFLGIGAVLIVSSALRAFGIHSFIVPNVFAPGGVTGIASMVEILSNGAINSGYIIFALNIPLIIISFKYLNWDFTLKTLASTILISLMLIGLEQLELNTDITFRYAPQQKILAALAGGVLNGAALAIMLKIGGSTGGTDILAALVNKKYSATGISYFIFFFDGIIVLVSAVLFSSLDPIMLSIVEMFVGARVSETILQGFKSAVRFEIIIDDPDELAAVIMQKLNRGVTCIKA